MAKPKVFISHITEETELARVLKKHLARDFLNFLEIYVSSDGKTIQAGSKWLDELSTALEEAEVEIILCSKESVRRPWVNFEAGAGWVRGIPVIPVCHSGMNPSTLPVPINMLQAIQANQVDSLRLLYETIAQKIDLQVPEADFEAIAQEVTELENKYRKAEHALERIDNPKILCASSEQYGHPSLGFELDVGLLQRLFPKQVVVKYNLTSTDLRALLTTERFDIVHLVLAVTPQKGDLIFSSIDDFETYTPIGDEVDMMSPDAFANYLAESGTRLVVLATCNALHLAAKVARHGVNMIACHTGIQGKDAEKWGECFYSLLDNGISLYKAFELAKPDSPIPMELIRYRDLIFAFQTKLIN